MSADGVSGRKTAGSRKTTALAWFAWALTAALIIANVPLGYLNDPSVNLGDIFYALVLLAFATVGVIIASRRPDNRIGWLLAAGTFLISLGGLALEYAVYALRTAPRSLQGGEWMLWFGAWVRSLGFFTLVLFVPLLFPNGKLPSPRWRIVARFAVGALVLFTVLNIFAPANQSELRLPPLPNPLGLAIPPGIFGPLNGISFLGIAVVTLIAAASVVIRFRRAEGEEREQLKWFAYAGIVASAIFVCIVIGTFTLPDVVMTKIGGILFSLLLAGFPITIGVAILKYRLYEIDLLINRTLVYVPLTGIIAGIFAASITLSQKFFIAITGQQSEAATVLTTLIVVAVFEPLKSGLQHLVDRRFKEAPDPSKQLKAYGNQVDAIVHVLNADESARRLLDETMKAFDATSGAVFLIRHGERQMVQQSGVSSDEHMLSVPLTAGGKELGLLSLGARKNGMEYGEDERAILQQIANSVAAALALTGQMDGARW